MKLRRFLLTFALCVLLLSLAVSASAAAQPEIGNVYEIDLLYQNSATPQQLTIDTTEEPDKYYATEDEVVAAMRAGWENRETNIVVGYEGTEDVDAIERNLFQNIVKHTGVPTQGDYLHRHIFSYGFAHYTIPGTNKTTFYCSMTYLSTVEQEERLNTEIATLLDSLNVYTASDYVKVKAIYDYICENITYDTEGLLYNNKVIYTAYSALVRKRAVCQGYANLFYRLALELNVDARLIPGTGDGGKHGWNIVKLGEYYYNLDPTWDAEIIQGGGEYAYFLKSPDDFGDHVRKPEYDTPEFHEKYPMDSENYVPPTEPAPEPVRNGWEHTEGKWFFYQDDVPANGWKLINGKWYYFDNTNGVMQTGWLELNGTWYYLDTSGAMVTGWLQLGNIWYYLEDDGAMQTGWLKVGSTWYYLRTSGAMATGWVQDGGIWYYFSPNGAMRTGWLKDGSTWYYLRVSGAMAVGWAQDGGTWYYFNAGGAMLTGWQKIGTTWYYFQSGGTMKTGWMKDGGVWYYFHSSGAMATGSVKIGTKTYNFNASGVCLNP